MANVENRAERVGSAAYHQKVIAWKFDKELCTDVLAWISEMTKIPLNTEGSFDNFHQQLKNGTVLCVLANTLKPDSCNFEKGAKGTFQEMANIGHFVDWMIKVAGVKSYNTFMTVDLYEAQNLTTVLMALYHIATNADKFGKNPLPKKTKSESEA